MTGEELWALWELSFPLRTWATTKLFGNEEKEVQPMTTEMSVLGAGTTIAGIPISGPGVPEPPAQLVAKQWTTLVQSKTNGNFFTYYYRLLDGRILYYHPFKGWKIWRPKKPMAVLYRGGKLDLKKATQVQKYLSKYWKSAKKYVNKYA